MTPRGVRVVPIVLGCVMTLVALLQTGASPDPAAGAATATAAATVTRVVLPLSGFDRILAAPTGAHVFVIGTPGPDDGTGRHPALFAVDSDGSDAHEIPGTDDALAMALSADGSTLFVTRASHHSVLAVDTRTLAGTEYPLGDQVCPRATALAASALWFVSDCDGYHASLDSWTPDRGVVVADTGLRTTDQDLVADGPATTSRLYLDDGNYFEEYSVRADGTGAIVVSRSNEDPGALLPRHPVASPDGRLLLGTEIWQEQVFDPVTVTPLDSLPAGTPAPVAAAVSDADVVALASNHDDQSPDQYDESDVSGLDDIYVYRPGSTRYATRLQLSTGTDEISPGALAFGDSTLYVVADEESRTSTTSQQVLYVISDPLSLPAPTPTTPAGSTALPLLHLGSTVSVPSAHRVLFAGGPRDNGVVATDDDGRHPRLLQHLPAPGRLSLSPDSRYAFTPLRLGEAVARIDTRTLAIRRFPTGLGSTPRAAAVAGGVLWVATGGTTLGLSPADGRVVAPALALDPDDLASVPGHPELLLAWSGGSPPALAVLRVSRSSGTPTLQVVHERALPVTDLTVTPDGLHLIVATGDDVVVLSSTSLNTQAVLGNSSSLGSEHPFVATAVRADGLVAAATDADFSVSRPSASLPLWTSPRGPLRATASKRLPAATVPHGLAFAGDRLLDVRNLNTADAVFATPIPTIASLGLDSDQFAYRPGARVLLDARLPVPTSGRVRVCVQRLRRGHATMIDCRRLRSGTDATFHTRAHGGDRYLATARFDQRTVRAVLHPRVTPRPGVLHVPSHE